MSHDFRPIPPHGTFAHIAQSMDPPVSPQHVRQVYWGHRVSARVDAAIEAWLAGFLATGAKQAFLVPVKGRPTSEAL